MTPSQLTGQETHHLVATKIGIKDFLVHAGVAQDLQALKQAANEAGFDLCIASGFRSFERQSLIWNNKMAGKSAIFNTDGQALDINTLSEHEKVMAILRWSALPGASRHHWGTDFDLYDQQSLPQGVQLQLQPWEYLNGHQAEFYQWLKHHLHQHGFFFPYHQDRGGVAVEPWHISHRVTSNLCLQQLTLAVLEQQIRSADILGKQVVLAQLESIYNRFISNIST